MRKYVFLILATFAAACASNSDQDRGSGQSKVPSDVQAAFFSEHPYAKISDSAQQNNQQDGTDYTIQYTRSDGSKGVAVYSSMGVLRSDN